MSERSPTANADRPYISLHFASATTSKKSEARRRAKTIELGIEDCTACGLDGGLPHVLP